MRGDVLSSRFRQMMQNSAKVSEAEARAEFIFNNRKTNFAYVSLSPTEIKVDADPSDDQLKAYYEENKSDFQSDEKRMLEYAIFERANFDKDADGKAIAKDEVDKLLTAEAEKLVAMSKSKPQVPFQAHVEKLKASFGKTGGAVARTDTIEAIKDSGVVTNKAFQLDKGSISEPFKGFVSGNYYVVRAADVMAAAPLPFEQAKNTVLLNYLESKRVEKADQLIEEALAGLKRGEDAAKVAKDMNLQHGETGLYQAGKVKDIPGVGYSVEATEQLIHLSTSGEASKRVVQRPLKIADKYVVFKAIEEQDPTEEDVSKELTAALKRNLAEKQRQAATGWVGMLRKQAEDKNRIEIYKNAQQATGSM